MISFGSKNIASTRVAVISDNDTVAGFASGLLDESYASNAVAAYSIRRLTINYTGSCLRIREDGGDLETDIGFDVNGLIDYAAMEAFCGANNGFVVTWYDQVGSANVTNATPGQQPQIVNSGTALDAPEFTLASNQKLHSSTTPITDPPFSFSTWSKTSDDTIHQTIISIADSGSTNNWWGLQDRGLSAENTIWHAVQGTSSANAASSLSYSLDVWHHGGGVEASATDRRAFLDGTNKGTDTVSRSPSGVDRIGVGSTARQSVFGEHNGSIAEAVIFSEAKSDANMASIHAFGDPTV